MASIQSMLGSATLKDSAILTVGQLVAAVQGALFFAITARLFSLADIGLYSIILATATILKDVVDPSLNALLMRFVPRSRPGSVRSVVRLSFLIKIGYFLLVIPVAIVFGDPISRWLFHEPFVFLLLSTVFLSMVMSLSSSVSGILQSHKRFRQDAMLTMLQPFLRLLLLATLLTLPVLEVNHLVFISIVTYVIASMIGCILIWPVLFGAKVSKQTIGTSTKFVSPLVFSTAMGAITDRVSLYAVNTFVSAAQAGLLGYIQQLFIPARQISGSLSSVFGSRFASFQTPVEAFTYFKKAYGLAALAALALLLTMPFGSILIRLIYGPTFDGGGLVFAILVAGFALLVLQTPLTAMMLYYFGRSDWMAKLSVVQLVATLITSLWLVPRYQALGAALSFVSVMILTTLITSLVIWHSWRRRLA